MASAAEQLIQRGKALGLAEGEARGKAESILAVLEARGLSISAEERARVLNSKDIGELERWLKRAVTVASVAELLSQ